MRLFVEILAPEVSEKAIPQLVGDIRDAVAAFGLTPVVSAYVPEPETVAAMDAIAPDILTTPEGQYARPTAAIHTYQV